MVAPKPIACLQTVVLGWALAILTGCGDSTRDPITLSLVERFEDTVVDGSAPIATTEPLAWRFDGRGTLPELQENGETYAWRSASGIGELAVDSGLLVGRTVPGEQPTLSLSRPAVLNDQRTLHAIEIRMRVSAGAELGVWFSIAGSPPGRARQPNDVYAMVSVPLEPGDEFRTYRLTNDAFTIPFGVPHILVEPTDAADATFAIESIRLITSREQLASTKPVRAGTLSAESVAKRLSADPPKGCSSTSSLAPNHGSI